MTNDIYLGLDVGSARIGAALARADVRLASPLTTIEAGEQAQQTIQQLIEQNSVTAVVVGWPRDMQGDETKRIPLCRRVLRRTYARLNRFAGASTRMRRSLPKAEAELKARNKPYQKSDIDALAATYILDDYLGSVQEAVHV